MSPSLWPMWWAQPVGAPLTYPHNIELRFRREKAEDYLHFLESVRLLASLSPSVRGGTCWWSLDVAESLRKSPHVSDVVAALVPSGGAGRGGRGVHNIGLPLGVYREVTGRWSGQSKSLDI